MTVNEAVAATLELESCLVQVVGLGKVAEVSQADPDPKGSVIAAVKTQQDPMLEMMSQLDGPVGVCWRAQKARGLGSKETTVKPFSRGPLTQKRRSNLDRIHMDSLIWIKMQVETTF